MGRLHPTSMADTVSIQSSFQALVVGFQKPQREFQHLQQVGGVLGSLADFAICCSHLSASSTGGKGKTALPFLCKMPTSFLSHVHFLSFSKTFLWLAKKSFTDSLMAFVAPAMSLSSGTFL